VKLSLIFVLFVPLSAEGNQSNKYNETEMENSKFITLQEFDEWLKLNDHYEAFVKAYNTSPDHPTVTKIKCLYELESIKSVDAEMTYDEIQQKCSSK